MPDDAIAWTPDRVERLIKALETMGDHLATQSEFLAKMASPPMVMTAPRPAVAAQATRKLGS